jgi:hypothetical protein
MFTGLKAEAPGPFSISAPARDSPVVVQESRRAVHHDSRTNDPTKGSKSQQVPPPQTRVIEQDGEKRLEEKVCTCPIRQSQFR